VLDISFKLNVYSTVRFRVLTDGIMYKEGKVYVPKDEKLRSLDYIMIH